MNGLTLFAIAAVGVWAFLGGWAWAVTRDSPAVSASEDEA